MEGGDWEGICERDVKGISTLNNNNNNFKNHTHMHAHACTHKGMHKHAHTSPGIALSVTETSFVMHAHGAADLSLLRILPLPLSLPPLHPASLHSGLLQGPVDLCFDPAFSGFNLEPLCHTQIHSKRLLIYAAPSSFCSCVKTRKART